MPPSTPRGTPRAAAIASSSSVPTIAFAIPPPVSPVGCGSWVKKFQSIDEAPSRIRKYSTRKSGAITTTAHTPISVVRPRLFQRRQRASSGLGRQEFAVSMVPENPKRQTSKPQKNSNPAEIPSPPNCDWGIFWRLAFSFPSLHLGRARAGEGPEHDLGEAVDENGD